jgi:4-hydroxy-tetrahydrodipicolinate synthase
MKFRSDPAAICGSPAKWVLHQQGLISSGYVRPPLVPPSEIGVARIRALLAEGGDLTAQI